ncbi:MAG: D-tyrosyl-tRNA(Tyr) deacylase [Planctomycetaceae bacterium]|nr:D-tyrosyl-tRNA(Tyr) deacylase [Planctomycetaceae bacterium]
MRAVIQRVRRAQVEVEHQIVGQIDRGLVILLGVQQGDATRDLEYLVDKSIGLRVFPDSEGKMNLSVREVGGSLLVVSQFTLLGDCRKGKRPSFIQAAPPEIAKRMYEQFIELARQQDLPVQSGVFQADMQLTLCNDGPVTIIVDSRL